MNHFFRLIWIWLTAKRYKTGNTPVTSCQRTFRVWPTDLDMLGHMTNSRYVSMMDVGRIDLLFCSGIIDIMKRDKVIPIVQSVLITYVKELKLWQDFTLSTKLSYWDERYVYIEQTFTSKDKVIAKGLVRGCFLKKGHRTSPKALIESIAPEVQSPQMSPVIANWLEALKEKKSES